MKLNIIEKLVEIRFKDDEKRKMMKRERWWREKDDEERKSAWNSVYITRLCDLIVF